GSLPTTSGTGVVVAFGPSETEIRTFEPFLTVVPAVGLSATTWPDGFCEETYFTREPRPTLCNRRCATVCCNPTTFGTLTVAAVVVVFVPLVVVPGEEAEPVETLIRTFDPRGTFLFG